ncbi:MAG: alkaline phosphatase family protein, partial [Chloroflexota bacterium]
MKFLRRFSSILSALVITIFFFGTNAQMDVSASSASQANTPNTPVEHFIVLMQENHTFDNYFGTYPGADGIPEGTCMPVDPFDKKNTECVEPFHIGSRPSEDLDHSLTTFKLQYNDGKMDGFIYALNQRNQNGAMTMAYYDDRDLPH